MNIKNDKDNSSQLEAGVDGWYVNDRFERLADEIARAQAKYPGNGDRILALSGELVELLSAVLHAKAANGPEEVRSSLEQVRAEAIQVAACAWRIVEEGDASLGPRLDKTEEDN